MALKLALTDWLNAVTENALPLKVAAIEELIEEDIKTCDADKEELITATSISVAISLYPIVPLMYIWDEPDTTPPGNTAATLFVIIFTIDWENVVCIDCETISFTEALKSVPICADVLNAEPLSICFNLIKFAISYKYLSLW